VLLHVAVVDLGDAQSDVANQHLCCDPMSIKIGVYMNKVAHKKTEAMELLRLD